VAYETDGIGPVILFIHGWAGYRSQWGEAPEFLKGFRTIALDLHGFGDSEESSNFAAPEDYTKSVCEFIEAIDVRRLVLVGHSTGGISAANAALRLTDIVDGLVLVESPVGKELASAKFPVLLIFGDRDSDMGGLSRLKVAGLQLEKIPAADLRFIEHASHSPMLDNPPEFYEVLHDFCVRNQKTA